MQDPTPLTITGPLSTQHARVFNRGQKTPTEATRVKAGTVQSVSPAWNLICVFGWRLLQTLGCQPVRTAAVQLSFWCRPATGKQRVLFNGSHSMKQLCGKKFCCKCCQQLLHHACAVSHAVFALLQADAEPRLAELPWQETAAGMRICSTMQGLRPTNSAQRCN